jgi:hypothetical protein
MFRAGRLEGIPGVGGPRTPEASSAAKVFESRGAENTLLQSLGGMGEFAWLASSGVG